LFEFDCEINIIARVNTLTNPFLKPTSTEQHRQCVLRKEVMLYITVQRV